VGLDSSCHPAMTTTKEPKVRILTYEQRLDVQGPEAAFNEDGVELS
jgi:hypothetical protein